MNTKANDWNSVAQRIQAIAQTGLSYATSPYDLGRYSELSAIAASMIAGPEPDRIPLAEELFAAGKGYATPKVDVRAAVFSENRLLLVRERADGCWALPGGWAEVGQSAAESVEREVREESGYIVEAVKLLACWDRNKHPHPPILFHAYKLVFRCELLSGWRLPARKQPRPASLRRIRFQLCRPRVRCPSRSNLCLNACEILRPQPDLTKRSAMTGHMSRALAWRRNRCTPHAGNWK